MRLGKRPRTLRGVSAKYRIMEQGNGTQEAKAREGQGSEETEEAGARWTGVRGARHQTGTDSRVGQGWREAPGHRCLPVCCSLHLPLCFSETGSNVVPVWASAHRLAEDDLEPPRLLLPIPEVPQWPDFPRWNFEDLDFYPWVLSRETTPMLWRSQLPLNPLALPFLLPTLSLLNNPVSSGIPHKTWFLFPLGL